MTRGAIEREPEGGAVAESAAAVTNRGEFCRPAGRRVAGQVRAWHIDAMMRTNRTRALHRLTRRLGLALCALAAISASAQRVAEQELLNSERIARQFGSYGIEVLEQSPTVRVSNLYSRTGEERVTRTFAVVLYPADVEPALADAHATIIGGGSIGAVLTEHGWQVRKRHRFLGALEPTRRLERMMGGIRAETLATHVYVLDAIGPGAEHEYEYEYEYATIVEVHHPDYLTVDDLRSIYGGSYTPPTRLHELEALVETLGIASARMRGAR